MNAGPLIAAWALIKLSALTCMIGELLARGGAYTTMWNAGDPETAGEIGNEVTPAVGSSPISSEF